MKKIVKLLPIALALALINPVFAEDLTGERTETGQLSSADYALTLTLDEFIGITAQAKTPTSTLSYKDDYSNIDLDAVMEAEFQVITNNRDGIQVKLTAKAGNTSYNALNATGADAFYLVFANTNATVDSESVSDAASASPTSANNPNCFAIKVTPSETAVANTGATALTTSSTGGTVHYNTTNVTYDLTNGIYAFDYKLDKKALDSTFSTKDTNGIYTSTLTLTKVSS